MIKSEIRTIDDLRVILASELITLRSGKTSSSRANAVARTTGQILSTIKLEMQYAKMLGFSPKIPMIQVKRELKQGSLNAKKRQKKA